MFLAIIGLGTGIMGCKVEVASINSIYKKLKTKKGKNKRGR